MLTAGNCHSKQKKVKLICSWPGTTIQNRKSKKNMFMARNCRSLCRYASRLDERLLYSGRKLMDELMGAKCDCSWISWLSLVITDNRMLKIITSVFIVTRRLEKHSILKFICFKLLGRCNIFTFSLVSLYFMTFSVCYGYLIDHIYISLAFDFWHVLAYGI